LFPEPHSTRVGGQELVPIGAAAGGLHHLMLQCKREVLLGIPIFAASRVLSSSPALAGGSFSLLFSVNDESFFSGCFQNLLFVFQQLHYDVTM